MGIFIRVRLMSHKKITIFRTNNEYLVFIAIVAVHDTLTRKK